MPVGAVLALLCALLLVTGGLASFVPGLVVLSPYTYDVLFTLIRRWRRGERVWTAHRSHLYQRLLIATGWSHSRLLAFHLPYWAMTVLLAMAFQFVMTLAVRDWRMLLTLLVILLDVGALLVGYTKLVWQAEARHAGAQAAGTEPRGR